MTRSALLILVVVMTLSTGKSTIGHANDAIIGVAGSVDSAGFSWRDGFWWKGGLSYHKYATYRQYDSCSRYVYYYYVLANNYSTPVPPAPVYKPAAKPLVDKVQADSPQNWREQLLAFATQKDRWHNDMKRSAQEHNEWIQSLEVLGLKGSYVQENQYLPQIPGNPYNYNQYIPNAQQGNGSYGTQYQSVASVSQNWGSYDPNAFLNQAAQLTQGAQQLAAQGQNGHLQAGALEGNNRARLMELQLRGEIARGIAKDTLNNPQSITTRQEITVGPVSRGKLSIGSGLRSAGDWQPGGSVAQELAKNGAQHAELAQSILTAKCASCHGTVQKAAKSQIFPDGFKVSEYPNYSPDQKRRAIDLVMTGDMPKDAEPLPFGEVAALFADWYATSANLNK